MLDLELGAPSGTALSEAVRSEVPQLLRVLVTGCDRYDRERLAELVEAVGSVPCACAHGELTPTAMDAQRHELLFLDPDTHPALLAMLAALLPENRPLLVFVADTPLFACRAFELGAVDFLLRPVGSARLRETLRRARDQLDLRQARRPSPGSLDIGQAATPPAQDLWIREHGTQHSRVPVAAIDWIASEEDYVRVYTAGRRYMLRSSLDKLQKVLDPAAFIRIHRTILVQRDRILSVRTRRRGGSEALLRDGSRLPVGRIHLARLPWRAK